MKKWLSCGAASLLLAASAPVMAEEWRLYTGAASYHFEHVRRHLPEDYQYLHKLLLVEYNGFFGGYTTNTFDDDLWIAGYNLEWRRPYVDIGVNLGVNYGYRDCFKIIHDHEKHDHDRQFCPNGGLTVFSNTQAFQPGLQINPAFVAFALRWEFSL